jgi:isocitrate dehydrogenase kinase/phosphatase
MDALRLAGEAIGERALWLQVHARYSALLQG